MDKKRSCCGGLRSRKRVEHGAALPDNPPVAGGVALIYVGAGTRRLEGAGSGLSYHVSDRRRHFRADRRDVRALLERADCILDLGR